MSEGIVANLGISLETGFSGFVGGLAKQFEIDFYDAYFIHITICIAGATASELLQDLLLFYYPAFIAYCKWCNCSLASIPKFETVVSWVALFTVIKSSTCKQRRKMIANSEQQNAFIMQWVVGW
jgi:hypothetical protein